MDRDILLKRNAEQVCAQVVESLKTKRVLQFKLNMSELNAKTNEALSILEETRRRVDDVIISNRGGITGKHGFIGEIIHVGFSNERDICDGKPPIHRLVDDNGMTDYYRGNTPIQQKACISDKALGLTHIAKHATKYPEFVEVKKGIYQIPRDFYLKYKLYSKMACEEAGKLSKAELRLWLRVHSFNSEHPNVVVEPMITTYKEIQVGKVSETFSNEKNRIIEHHKQTKHEIVSASKASINEGLKCTIGGAAFEGAIGGAISLYKHTRPLGKNVVDLKSSEWRDIGVDTIKASGKGAIRCASIYALTNKVGMPAHWACATTTAAMGTVSSVYKYNRGDITVTECIHEIVGNTCDAAVVALGSKLGSKLIPVPFIGNIVGGTMSLLLWDVTKNMASHLYDEYRTLDVDWSA